MADIACIGSRDLTLEQIQTCEKLGAWIVRLEHRLHSGNAPGADQAYARGGNQVNPSLVHLHLPWPKFERHAVHPGNKVRTVDNLDSGEKIIFPLLAKKYHPTYERLSQGAQKLMTRNSMILFPSGPVDMVIALPSAKRGGGGTGQGMRMAEGEGITLRNIRGATRKDLQALCEEIRGLA